MLDGSARIDLEQRLRGLVRSGHRLTVGGQAHARNTAESFDAFDVPDDYLLEGEPERRAGRT
ncbi:hypothetical protein AKJ09_04521 [Labilithrix luteola]|uniref:Uncharacterized protein n=1 Tax=Labilithrix luteola TaxID=1391654 RepID=A0A0K1PWG2_9BACT|nr:hypothetical protein AKJ09_04521 [Labilithrix luteola]